jgi:fructokinase
MLDRAEAVPPAILCFGEVLWDVFCDREVIGGAPFNVAVHLARLGVRSFIYSRLGPDLRGVRARHQAVRFGLCDRWLQEDRARPTGWVDITLDASGQPGFRIGANAAWDHIEAPPAGLARELRTGGFSAIVCGTLASRSPESRTALAAIRTALPDVPVFYDVNLRGRDTPIERVREILPGVTLLKVNVEEARQLSHELFDRAMAPADLFLELRGRHGIKLMLCTRGEEGCEILSAEGEFVSRPERVKVASAVGAGDAFSAAFLAGWVKGLPLGQTAANANRLGAYVAASPETIPEYSAALLAQLAGLP